MEIPFRELNKDTLRRLIESFISREGTDYGERVFTMDEKVLQVQAKLEDGSAMIIFDQDTETFDIVPKEEIQNHTPRPHL